MATIVNIFGKLYTFLRRPQPEQNGADENQLLGQNTDCTTQKGAVAVGAEKADVSQQSERNEQGVQDGGAPRKKMDQFEKCMTDSTASSDWEHIPEASGQGQKMADGVDRKNSAKLCSVKPEIQLNESTLSGTDIDAAYAVSLNSGQLQDSSSKEEKRDANTCQDNVEMNKSVTSPEKIASQDAGKPAVTDEGSNDQTQNRGNVSEKSGKEGSGGKKCKESKKGKDEKVCKYYSQGQKCWRGTKCKFAHLKEGKQVNSDDVAETVRPEKAMDEEEFSSYIDFVYHNTEHGVQIKAKDLFYKLGFEKGADLNIVGDAVLGQYRLAKSRNNWPWVKDARYFAELFFAPDWIDQNLPHRDVKSNRKNRQSKKSKHNPNENFENPSGICRDFRLKENPDIQTVCANAAGDSNSNTVKGKPSSSEGPAGNHGDGANVITGKPGNVDELVTDYTEQVIQEAMKMAISDGLSESAIMEVIDDVTSGGKISTPRKHGKQAKLDVSRTPRCRPEQLALGFNYHSDLVVQQSPKTVRGEIIPLDTLPQPRERPEQLAVSFNYLAEQLIKESPKTETGEVLIPGVITTPRRLARDQLAIGFNYHSDLIAKDSPSKGNQNENIEVSEDKNAKNKKNNSHTLMNGIHNGCSEELGVNSKVKSAKRSISDTFAVGFSYNSDQIIKESLDEINGNLPNDNNVLSLIEDAVIGEGRNIVEVTDEIPASGLPAGSVW
ncbi:uncharacterized protein LOC123551790 [Mercenaria mercenaria]|uniref:uncharacterized protein LOC123551790 n=1 Tax=Mercenaria mercenaria TaxID=6596 RepID=UPI00234E6E66|nr:uncharacterized protein LOC123551790 [Mercenaria mercenaria]